MGLFELRRESLGSERNKINMQYCAELKTKSQPYPDSKLRQKKQLCIPGIICEFPSQKLHWSCKPPILLTDKSNSSP